MARNVEIKARLTNPSATMNLAAQLSGGPSEVIEQEDVFFCCTNGRLKLRVFAATSGQLIHYQRPDQPGPATSDYLIAATTEPAQLREALSRAYGVVAVVRKTRHLFMLGRTRIHIDSVEGLGDFLELEVVLEEGEPVRNGEEEIATLMDALSIDAAALIDVAYVDQLTSIARRKYWAYARAWLSDKMRGDAGTSR